MAFEGLCGRQNINYCGRIIFLSCIVFDKHILFSHKSKDNILEQVHFHKFLLVRLCLFGIMRTECVIRELNDQF